ncbi:zinc ribbon domain-containing protein [Streptomyces sp. NPDC051020]|uniref:double zinc ribbon domain-containing protein n=1 Tax=Streptomyces sp. NPDC051020 TaxID=3155409 RepID=UPI003438A9DA
MPITLCVGLDILEWVQRERPLQRPRCTRCVKVIEDSNWVACPYCGQLRRRECNACGEQIQAAWKACPHCGHSV